MLRILQARCPTATYFAPLCRQTLTKAVASRPSGAAIHRYFSSEAPEVHPKGPVFKKVACIGTGKMAQAVMEPMIKNNVQPADQMYVYDVSDETMKVVQERLGVHISNSLSDVVSDADLVICAVKPQNLNPAFWSEIRKGRKAEDGIFLSVIAGKPMETFYESGFTKLVRSMPNTPAMIGQGMTVWSCTPNLTQEQRRKIRQILSSCGKSLYVDSEEYIDMSTSISGSGPAYIFLLMEAMIDGAVHMGFPRDKATTLVYHTMLGSTLYAMESKEHPAILRNSVTSPSGTTASALYELENGKLRTVIKDAMWACYRRSLEMGNHDSSVGPGRFKMAEPKITLYTDSDDEGGGSGLDGARFRLSSDFAGSSRS